ncbi:Tat pathway signal sequence domain protein, partial [Nonomuraea angiospora]
MTALRWLDRPGEQGVTWGVPWPRGAVERDAPFALADPEGREVPVQSWVTATWPDGSVKWSAHAIGARPAALSYRIEAGREPAAAATPVTVARGDGVLTVSTGVVTWTIEESGGTLARSISRGSREIARDVRLVSLRQSEPTPDDGGPVARE